MLAPGRGVIKACCELLRRRYEHVRVSESNGLPVRPARRSCYAGDFEVGIPLKAYEAGTILASRQDYSIVRLVNKDVSSFPRAIVGGGNPGEPANSVSTVTARSGAARYQRQCRDRCHKEQQGRRFRYRLDETSLDLAGDGGWSRDRNESERIRTVRHTRRAIDLWTGTEGAGYAATPTGEPPVSLSNTTFKNVPPGSVTNGTRSSTDHGGPSKVRKSPSPGRNEKPNSIRTKISSINAEAAPELSMRHKPIKRFVRTLRPPRLIRVACFVSILRSVVRSLWSSTAA